MRWIYLSPHFDDAPLSCGGLIAGQVRDGETAEIWTVFAAYPPRSAPLPAFAREKHRVWQVNRRSAIQVRREEERKANALLGTGMRWGSLPDCIYRRLPDGTPLISDNDDLWLPVHPGENGLIRRLAAWMRRGLRPDDRLVCPLTLGDHVDHRLVRAAAELLRRPLWYYADYPYAVRLGAHVPPGLPAEQIYSRIITPADLQLWQRAVACYATQMEDLFAGPQNMPSRLEDFWKTGGGSLLWQV